MLCRHVVRTPAGIDAHQAMLRVARRRSGVTLEEVCFEGEVVGSVESWIDESSLLIELERQPSGKTEDGERLVRAQLMSGRGG